MPGVMRFQILNLFHDILQICVESHMVINQIVLLGTPAIVFQDDIELLIIVGIVNHSLAVGEVSLHWF